MVLAGCAGRVPRAGRADRRGCVISCGHFTVSGAAVGDRPGRPDQRRVDQGRPSHSRDPVRLLPRLDGHGPVDQPLPRLPRRDDQLDQLLGGARPYSSSSRARIRLTEPSSRLIPPSRCSWYPPPQFGSGKPDEPLGQLPQPRGVGRDSDFGGRAIHHDPGFIHPATPQRSPAPRPAPEGPCPELGRRAGPNTGPRTPQGQVGGMALRPGPEPYRAGDGNRTRVASLED